MKLKHTDAMKDNDKPEAPEGYTVMLGKDIRAETPKFMWLFSCEEWSDWGGDQDWRIEADWWYAVPNAKPEGKPEAPEGYQIKTWEELPDTVPLDCKWWCPETGRWEVSGSLGSPKENIIAGVYAVPNAKPDGDALHLRGPYSRVSPDTDPKASQAIQKPQLQLIPPALNDETAKALMRGAEKYGFFNWRENRVEMMTYLGAMKRHIDHIIDGDHEGDIDPDTGAHHLGCVAAGCGIVLDARKHGTLVDNRPPKGQNI
jgi:hypothetical protein